MKNNRTGGLSMEPAVGFRREYSKLPVPVVYRRTTWQGCHLCRFHSSSTLQGFTFAGLNVQLMRKRIDVEFSVEVTNSLSLSLQTHWDMGLITIMVVTWPMFYVYGDVRILDPVMHINFSEKAQMLIPL